MPKETREDANTPEKIQNDKEAFQRRLDEIRAINNSRILEKIIDQPGKVAAVQTMSPTLIERLFNTASAEAGIVREIAAERLQSIRQTEVGHTPQ